MPHKILGVVMDPIDQIHPANDTTLGLLLAAQQAGWQLQYMTPSDVFWRHEQPFAHTRQLSVADHPQQWFSWQTKQIRALTDCDVILIRVDPPFDARYLQLTLLLEQASRMGVQVINDPRSLRDANEKCLTLRFPELCPPTLISAQKNDLLDFMDHHQRIIIKPLDLCGGRGIFLCEKNDPNHQAIIDTSTEKGQQWIMAQRFLPEIKNGDKRILMLHGEPVPYALARVPATGDIRGNMAAGGRAHGMALSDRDRHIAKTVGPLLRDMNLNFVGLDVIGDYLTEINVTSPTGMRQLNRAFNLDIGADFIATLGH